MATTVQSIDRAFAVLRQVAHEPGGISEVARATHLPVSTVARLGPQIELVTRQRSKRIPSRAIRSMLGVSSSRLLSP